LVVLINKGNRVDRITTTTLPTRIFFNPANAKNIAVISTEGSFTILRNATAVLQRVCTSGCFDGQVFSIAVALPLFNFTVVFRRQFVAAFVLNFAWNKALIRFQLGFRAMPNFDSAAGTRDFCPRRRYRRIVSSSHWDLGSTLSSTANTCSDTTNTCNDFIARGTTGASSASIMLIGTHALITSLSPKTAGQQTATRDR